VSGWVDAESLLLLLQVLTTHCVSLLCARPPLL
jgi:hypothetical protein